MSAMPPLLIEIGTDELPVQALPGLARALFDGVVDGLVRRGVAIERGDAAPLYTPRRLAVLLPGVALEQPEQRGEVLGPYVNIALDADGNPTRALQGFAQKAGVEWGALERTTDAKGERFVHRSVTPGKATADLLPDILLEAVAAMPIPRPMRWGAHAHAFARPVHWLVVLLGDQVVDAEIFGLRSDRMSRGHRFLHDGPVWIGMPGDYVDSLRAAHVLVDPAERRERIVREVEAAAATAGGTARIAPDNLAQVECLVEWPEAVACSFDRAFLQVPAEALVATMEANQKFFPVVDAHGALTEHFVGVANIPSTDVAEIRKGYERVIRPRFADAKFFFDEDLKQGLASMGEGLATVTYQAKLGSVADKVARVVALAGSIADDVGVDPGLARRAVEERPAVAHGERIPGAAGHRRAALCGRCRRVRRSGGRHRRSLDAAFRRGRHRAVEAGAGAGDRRTARHADRWFQRRAQADRQQGSFRAASLLDFDRRLRAIGGFATLPEAEALAAANKRSRNILRKVEGDVPTAIDPALFTEDAERELAAAVDAAIADTDPLLAQRDYVAVLGRLARLRAQVDAFFDQVMVNAEDPAIRDNRLALLKRLSDRLGSVAAIEHLSL